MAQHQLRTAAQQALEALGLWATGRDMDAVALNDLILRLEAALENQFNPDWDRTEALQESLREHMAEIHRLRAALAEPCPCADRPAAQCPGEWEPGCDLGNNPKYAKRVEMTPKELAASIKRGEKWKVAEPVQENKDA